MRGGSAPGRYERLTLVALDDARFVTVDGRAYRGVVEVFAGAGGLTVVNVLPLEAYLPGVVNAEMGRRAAAIYESTLGPNNPTTKQAKSRWG